MRRLRRETPPVNVSPPILTMLQRINGSRKVAIILHQEHSTPGRLGRLLKTQGFDLDIRRPRFGDPLPETLAEYAGAIIFGGPMSANDEEDWLRREIDWIEVPLKEEKPFLGICLGAQMLARHLGATRLSPHPEGKVEVGYYPDPSDATRGMPSAPARSPRRSINGIARDSICRAIRFCLPRAKISKRRRSAMAPPPMAFNSIREVTYAMMCRWTVRGTDRMGLPGAHPRHLHLEGWFQHDARCCVLVGGVLEKRCAWQERRRQPEVSSTLASFGEGHLQRSRTIAFIRASSTWV